MCLRVVASVTASDDKSEGKAVDQSSFLKTDSQLVSVFLSLDIVGLLDVVFKGASMNSPYYEVVLSKFKYLIQHREVCFLLFSDHHSLSKRCISD